MYCNLILLGKLVNNNLTIYNNFECFIKQILQINLKTHFNFDGDHTEFKKVLEKSYYEKSSIEKSSLEDKIKLTTEIKLEERKLDFSEFNENEKNLITILASNILKINILKFNKYYI